MAVRTLTDGMETGIASVAAVGLALITSRTHSSSDRVRQIVGEFLLAFTATLLRIDLLVLVLAVAILELGRPEPRARLTGVAVCCGALAAIIMTMMIDLHLLSDGAVAKHDPGGIDTFLLKAAATAHLAAGSFGVGLVAAWVASWWRLNRDNWMKTAQRARFAVVNLLGPVFWLVAILSGQITHGIRYFVPFYVFTVVCNAKARRALGPDGGQAADKVVHGRPMRLAAVCVVFACLWVAETMSLRTVVASRSRALSALERAEFRSSAGRSLLAFDAGMVGYFSRAEVCDPRGLLNGRAFAELSYRERLAQCWRQDPAFVFLSPAQESLLPVVNDWPICVALAMGNVRSLDIHRLRARPAIGCPPGLHDGHQ